LKRIVSEFALLSFRFDIVDRPGQLGAIVAVLSKAGANIVEVSHQRIFTDLPAKAVHLEVVIETKDRSHLASTVDLLRAADLSVNAGAIFGRSDDDKPWSRKR
jgi:threonine dehydratase